MRLSIERIRTLVLATGVLLFVVLVGFLAVGRWKNPFNGRDIPKRLGIDIQQEANGVTYTQAHGGHTIFKIHASRVVQLKNDQATLHDVSIEIYGKNGVDLDRIQGNEFEYNQKTGVATAAGPVQITLTRTSSQQAGVKAASPDEAIQVRTRGLVFSQQTGIASTDQRVDFSSREASGSAMGASYDSDRGLLILDRAVQLTSTRGPNPVEVHARHAEFDRNEEVGHLQDATARTRGRQAAAGQARIDFRDDGSIQRVEASSQVALSTDAGSHMTAPRGLLAFDQHNQPVNGRFEGGVMLESATAGRQMDGTAPTMTVAFDSAGDLRHAHLEGGVEMHSRQQSQSVVKGHAVPVAIARTWRSQMADVDFRAAGKGQVEPAQLHGVGNVVLTSEVRRGKGPPQPSRLAADEVTGLFGPRSTLQSVTGAGHATMEETSATGARQTASGDRVVAKFASPTSAHSSAATAAAIPAAQIESAELDGQVTLVQQPAGKAGAKAQPPLRVTAGHAVYQAAGQWLHLTVNPRMDQGGMNLTADRVDVSQQSGDAFAHGNVKATWRDEPGSAASGSGNALALGGRGPVHAVAADAQLHQPTGEARLRGHARLWQQDNSISAPLIVINRRQQTLSAMASAPAEPVIAVLLSAESTARPAAHAAAPSVVRVRGGDLSYSGSERKAVMRAAPLSVVAAQSNGVASTSAQVDLYLAPPGPASHTRPAAPAQVERMNAVGNVVLTSQGRRGTGEQLAYSGRTGEYVLTGTPSAPPRLTDPQRGSVTGAALIFNSRDDSVSIEGRGQQTTTKTTAPR